MWYYETQEIYLLLIYISQCLTVFLRLWFFCSIEWSPLFSVFYSFAVQNSSHNMILHPWKILYSSSSNCDNWMLLEIMSFSSNISVYLISICQSYFCYFTQGWVWFFWRHSCHLGTYSSFHRTPFWKFCYFPSLERVFEYLKSRRFRFFYFIFSRFFYELTNSRHFKSIRKIFIMYKVNALTMMVIFSLFWDLVSFSLLFEHHEWAFLPLWGESYDHFLFLQELEQFHEQ